MKNGKRLSLNQVWTFLGGSVMAGLSRARVTRLSGQYLESGAVKERNYRRNRFVKRYQAVDVDALLRPVGLKIAA